MVKLKQWQIERFRRKARRAIEAALISREKYEHALANAERERDFFNEQLGFCLRASRRLEGISLRAFARKMKLSASYVSDVELGRRAINAKLLDWLKGLVGRPNRGLKGGDSK